MNDLREYLAERHRPDACPCRKRHHPAPKPTAPDAPANTGKQARRLREAFDALEDARDTADENAIVQAERCVAIYAYELEVYRHSYEQYRVQACEWSSDACGDCGKSLHVVAPTLGCGRCLSADAVAILDRMNA